MQRVAFRILSVCLGIFFVSAAAADAWPDTRLARTELLALVQTLNADLLSGNSATLTLDRWCASHKLASPSTVIAERIRGADKAPSADIRALLRVGADEPVNYRRVQLKCGTHILSEADNWYVPSRLTPEMNRQLETSDIAFGRAVQALNFRRQTLAAKLLWEPLAPGWDMRAAEQDRPGATVQIPPHILEHRAVLLLPDGTPFSTVVESYTAATLDFRRLP
jgi:chorismate-pyruvate lyase